MALDKSKVQRQKAKVTRLVTTTETHFLSKRPQCQACGNPKLLQEMSFSPLSLTSRKKHFTTDGGHRAFTPDQTTKRYKKGGVAQ
ncbi:MULTISPECIES: TOMM precursor leader peptide-binding protein [unclassified Okeania]|uniref:TOMM precursor leader peptide-binding protein n=1 Tax=unclassified Okeania TaxID=2634635 RepID=UPI00257FB047|nr:MULTISPECIES: TOMM precursor leader peptide-binding protein [unclassified Okeania]